MSLVSASIVGIDLGFVWDTVRLFHGAGLNGAVLKVCGNDGGAA